MRGIVRVPDMKGDAQASDYQNGTLQPTVNGRYDFTIQCHIDNVPDHGTADDVAAVIEGVLVSLLAGYNVPASKLRQGIRWALPAVSFEYTIGEG
ncbi:MAG: hypothetical protein ABIJ75_07210 [Actinomycetota bacterium]